MKGSGRLGSVSIFFIAATAGFVLLTGLLIDFARIAAFRKQAELSVKSGVRSVLSAYDPELYGRFGLFARGGDPADELFRETLEGNLEPKNEDAFRLLDAEWRDDGVMESRPLASHEVYKRQVLEEMKYKAPIDLTIELASRFRGIAPALEEAGSAVDVLERMRKAYDRREAALDQAYAGQEKAGRLLADSFGDAIPDPAVPLLGSRSAGTAATIADAALMYGDYVAKKREDADRAAAYQLALAAYQERKRQAEEEKRKFTESPPGWGGPLYSTEIAAYEQSVSKLGERLASRPSQANADASAELSGALKAVAEAQAANEEMARIAREAETASVSDSSWGAIESDPDAAVGSDKQDSLSEVRSSASELVLDDSFFASYRDEINDQAREGIELATAASSLASLLGGVAGAAGLDGALRDSAGKLQTLGSEYRSRYGDADGTILERRRQRLAENRSGDEERKKLENEAETAWKGAGSLLGGFAGDSSSEEEKRSFERLKELTEANLSWNEQAKEEEAEETDEDAMESSGTSGGEEVDDSEDPVVPSEPESARDEAMKSSGSWLGALGEAAIGGRDALYYSEYAAERFSYADPAEVKRWLESETDGIAAEDQQLEYVLYGISSPTGNIAAAYAEIFAARLAIRTMEGLIESRKYGHPLVVLAAALLYAVQHAIADMNDLLNKGKIPLSRYAKVDTEYLDYLRIFLLLHGNSKSRFARSIAVSEAESGLAFDRLYTYVSGEGTASLRLWFFPGIAKLLSRAGSWGGDVRDGQYEASYKADLSYQ